MREEPIISRAILKAALVILVGGALGVGAYSLAGGGIDLPDLPDLPEIDTTDTTGEATELTETTIEGTTTIGGDQEEPTDPFTSAGFAAAIGKVRGAIGPGVQLTRLFINDVQTQFIVRRGDGVEAYSVRADTGELERADATITISGNATIDDFVFALDAIEPAAVDRMLAAARKEAAATNTAGGSGGAGDFEPSVLNLERQIPFGSRELRWTISAQGGGRNLTYRAAADGGDLENVGGKGTAIPQAAQEAEKLNDCIQAAGSDPNAILACLERFQ
jgi:hypothetical protein